MPKTRKAPNPEMWSASQAKFWPKNPVTNVSGRNTVAMMVSRSIVELCRTLIWVCSTEMTAMLASRMVASRSRWAETSSLTSSRSSVTSRKYGRNGVLPPARSMNVSTASSGCTAR